MKYIVKIQDRKYTFDYSENDKKISNQNNEPLDYDWVELGNGCFSLILNGNSYICHVSEQNGGYRIMVDGETVSAAIEDEQSLTLNKFVKAHAKEPSEQVIKAPIPGLVTRIFVQAGDKLKKNASLLALEAMKMENLIKAPCECTVEKIFVKSGQTVQQNQPLIQLKKLG